jgi:hypothetical protein
VLPPGPSNITFFHKLQCCGCLSSKHPFVCVLQGFVSPDVAPGTQAAVFAVYDEQQKLQYIGFSKELRSSLRTVLGRRPDKAFYFKCAAAAAAAAAAAVV